MPPTAGVGSSRDSPCVRELAGRTEMQGLGLVHGPAAGSKRACSAAVLAPLLHLVLPSNVSSSYRYGVCVSAFGVLLNRLCPVLYQSQEGVALLAAFVAVQLSRGLLITALPVGCMLGSWRAPWRCRGSMLSRPTLAISGCCQAQRSITNQQAHWLATACLGC